jgi:hypothetical protein
LRNIAFIPVLDHRTAMVPPGSDPPPHDCSDVLEPEGAGRASSDRNAFNSQEQFQDAGFG